MSQQPPPPRTRPRWTAVSIALLILGLLILVPSGLCTASVLGNASISMEAILLLGGMPMAWGASLVYLGFTSRRANVGSALFVIGLLILLPAGLCTVFAWSQGGVMLGMVLLMGGVPMAIGATLAYTGLKLRRRD